MPLHHFDVIVIGTGGVGSAALYHLTLRGATVLGLDRFPPGHNRGSSHGDTRLFRMAYSEGSHYVPLAKRSYELWHELSAKVERDLFIESGVLQVGEPGGKFISGIEDSAKAHGLAIDRFSGREATKEFPGFDIPDDSAVILEKQAGFVRVEEGVRSHIGLAIRLGAELETGERVQRWEKKDKYYVVYTEKNEYWADKLVITSGSWSPDFLGELGKKLRILRKPLYWFESKNSDHRLHESCPAFAFDTPEGLFYGFPQIDDLGLKVAEHSGGVELDTSDLLNIDRSEEKDREFQVRVERFSKKFLPGLTTKMNRHEVCFYTVTPDENFIVDYLEGDKGIVTVAGLSGHGYKFAPVLGEIVSELITDGKSKLPIDFLSSSRF